MNERKLRKIIQEEMNSSKNDDKPPVWFEILLLALVLMAIFSNRVVRTVLSVVICLGIAYIVFKVILYFKNRR